MSSPLARQAASSSPHSRRHQDSPSSTTAPPGGLVVHVPRRWRLSCVRQYGPHVQAVGREHGALPHVPARPRRLRQQRLFPAVFKQHLLQQRGKTVSLWDSRSGLCIQTLYGHSNSCNSAACNLRGDTIVSSDADGGVRIWDIRMVQQRLHIDAGPLPANKYSLAAPSAACCGSFRHTLQVLFRPQRHSLARRLRL